MNQEVVTMQYTNYKGVTAARSIIPTELLFGTTEFHKDPQWLLKAFDIDKQANRVFALRDTNFMAMNDE